MSTRSSKTSSPKIPEGGFTVKKIQRHGLSIFAFNINQSNPGKPVSLAVVLRPTAEAIGLNSEWFETTLRRSRNESVVRSVRELAFKLSDFEKSHRHGDGATLPRKGGTGLRPYQCLPITKLEVLLNGVHVERLKNPQARVSVLNLQKTINEVIERYHHNGVVVNPKIVKTRTRSESTKIRELSARVKTLEEDFAIAKKKYFSLLESRRAVASEYTQLAAEYDELATVHSSMLELKRARIRVLKEKNARLAEDIVAGRETHEAELNEVVAKYLEVVEESAKAKIAYEEATSELKARIRRLSSKKVQEAQRAEEATKQLEELEVQMSEADKEKDRLKSVVRALKAERKEETRELRFILRHLREELPEFMHDQTSLTIDDLCELPVYFKQNYMDFLTQLRDSFRPFLEEGSLGGVFRTMTLSLFPELSPVEYDRIVSGFTHTPPSSGSDVFENAPTAKLPNR